MRKFFTIREKLFIESHPELSAREISSRLNRNITSIKNFRWRNNCKATRKGYKKGMTPWNKGIKYNAGGRSIETRFKKGNSATTRRQFGEVFMTKDHGKDFLFINLKENRNYPYQRFIYEREHDVKLSSNEIVIFLDGNQLNCDIKNLRAITRRENLMRNLNRKKGGESLRKTWGLVKTFEDFGLKPPYKLRSKRA